MKRFLPTLSILLITQGYVQAQATHPYTNCPDVNIAIVRAGTNSDITNPYYLYNVNQATGAMTLVPGGPYKDPLQPAANLQVNGVGVNRQDGYIYGIAFDGTVTTGRFVRMDQNYGVTSLGAIPSPASGTGLLGFVNPAAGDMDTAGNYYFSAFTLDPNPTLHFDKFYIGKIANTQSMVAGPPVVTYHEVNITGANCSNYTSTFTTDPANSGLKDFSYNAKTNSFFTYATYKMPGAANFSAQLLELVPVPGSSPLTYQLICNPMINTHTAETSGTIIDKTGRFTVLFTDGSFGMLNTDITGAYTGAFTVLNPATGLPNPLRGDMGSCGLGADTTDQPPVASVMCPASFAVAREGMNADITNPYFIYTVNDTTGELALVPGGPLYYPGTQQTLQVNGVGLNKTDSNFYGLAFEGSITTARLVRFDINYNVELLGNIPGPVSATGPLSFVNSAAGTVDGMDNYYFTAATATAGLTPGTLVLDKLYLGKIANVSTVAGTPTPVYYEVKWTENNCNDFISSLSIDPVNSGVKDLFYHPITRTFFTYVTFKLPGDVNYRGQLLELRETNGYYKLHCKNVTNTHTAEVSGTMLGNNGAFLVLMTDGSIGYVPRTGNSYNYSGHFTVLNDDTILPDTIRGDLASCVTLQRNGNQEHEHSGRAPFVFSLHPNPVDRDQLLHLRWTEVQGQARVDITIHDSYGTIVRTLANTTAVEGNVLNVNVANLVAGIYYVTAYDRNTRKTYKLKFMKL